MPLTLSSRRSGSVRRAADLRDIVAALKPAVPKRTLQYRLKHLVDAGRLAKDGDDRWAKYRVPVAEAVPAAETESAAKKTDEAAVPLSSTGQTMRAYLSQPVNARKPVGYNREFLDSYRPNETFYLSEEQRGRLARIGKPNFKDEAAGTYAKKILNRLLIDLSWNSSRLEGNTYSLLDTTRLIELGEAAEGRDRLEAQMIVNHKDAIEFMVNRCGGHRLQPLHDSQPSRHSGPRPSARPRRAGQAAPHRRGHRQVDLPSPGASSIDRGVFQRSAGESRGGRRSV